MLFQNLVKEVKEEYDADDAVSSSSHVARFINASVQTPNKLLRMVAEEICGQSARKPHADRDFKVRCVSTRVSARVSGRGSFNTIMFRSTPRSSAPSSSRRRSEPSTLPPGTV